MKAYILESFLNETLPLGNWKVDVKYFNEDAMQELTGRENCCGYTIFESLEYAHIFINADYQYPDDDCIEKTLIHEYLHVVMHGLDEHMQFNQPNAFNEYYQMQMDRISSNLAKFIYELIESNEDVV
jgi:hypothetical protein